jgi:hypothetical protein
MYVLETTELGNQIVPQLMQWCAMMVRRAPLTPASKILVASIRTFLAARPRTATFPLAVMERLKKLFAFSKTSPRCLTFVGSAVERIRIAFLQLWPALDKLEGLLVVPLREWWWLA